MGRAECVRRGVIGMVHSRGALCACHAVFRQLTLFRSGFSTSFFLFPLSCAFLSLCVTTRSSACPKQNLVYSFRSRFSLLTCAPIVSAAISWKSSAHFFLSILSFSSFAKRTGTSSRFARSCFSPTLVALCAPCTAGLRVGPYCARSDSHTSSASAMARINATADASSDPSKYLRALCP